MHHHMPYAKLSKIQCNDFRPNLNQNTWRPFRAQVSSSYGAPPCGTCGSGSSGGSGNYVPPTQPRPSYEAPNSFVTPVRPISVINPIKPSIGFRLVSHWEMFLAPTGVQGVKIFVRPCSLNLSKALYVQVCFRSVSSDLEIIEHENIKLWVMFNLLQAF